MYIEGESRKEGKGKNGIETEVQRVCKTLVKGTYYPVGRFVYTLVDMQVRERELGTVLKTHTHITYTYTYW